jgi:NADH-quinone oxidoreductase subunit N
VASANEEGVAALLYYLAAYTFMVAGSFGVVTLVGRHGDGRHHLDDFRGLSHSNPVLSLVFTLFLLAQAGIPFTSGFFAKFTVIGAAVTAELYWLAILAMVSAVVAAFLYLRLVVAMYMTGGEHGEDPGHEPTKVSIPWTAGVGLAICVVVTLGAGIVPDTIYGPAEDGVPVLVEPTEPVSAAPTIGPFDEPAQAPAGP